RRLSARNQHFCAAARNLGRFRAGGCVARLCPRARADRCGRGVQYPDRRRGEDLAATRSRARAAVLVLGAALLLCRARCLRLGYRTYPHIDMAETGGRAARLLDRLLKDRRPLYKAYRQIDFLIPLVWQCTLAEPAKGIFELIDEIEQGSRRGAGSNRGLPGGSHNQGIVSITHTPGFPPADIKECGPALVVYGLDRDAA